MQVPIDRELPQELSESEMEGTQSISQSRILSVQRSKKISNARVHAVFPRPDGSPIRVGHDVEESDIVLDEGSVSKYHAELTKAPSGWKLVDLDSNNGTFMEGERLPAGVLMDLRGGQSLSFSSYMALWLTPALVFQLADHVRTKRHTKRKL